MTAKEKAWEIFYEFKTIPDKWKNEKVFQNYYAKQCALLAVDNILNEYWSHDTKRRDWWQEVKKEIEKL
jgi:hypothetical protein